MKREFFQSENEPLRTALEKKVFRTPYPSAAVRCTPVALPG